MHLYETHLPVANTETAKEFYTTIVGLPFAYRDPTRDIVFLWAVSREQGMVGLWGPGTAYGPANNSQFKHHLAFAVTLPELFRINENLRNNGVETVGFWGGKASEPSVIGWMPSAQIYFRDPDGHTVEFISILPEPANLGFIGSYSQWEARCAGKT
ncbi:MAG TPA: VOC family protein [Chthoniobacterales bacterium]|jgi:lactoylglutathione lyase|nr:VOC family protein [Chthoniobacterales bacterium]